MSQSTTNSEDLTRITNKVRDTFGVVSVTGIAILTVYALAKMTSVWIRSSDEEPATSPNVVKS